MNTEKKEWSAPKVEELVFTQTAGGSPTPGAEVTVSATRS